MNKLEWIEHEKYGWYYLKRYPFFNSYIRRQQIGVRTFYQYGNTNYDTLEQAKEVVVFNLKKACKEILNTPQKGLFILISNNHLYNSIMTIQVAQYIKTVEIKGMYRHCSRIISFNSKHFNINTVIDFSIKILIRHCNKFLNQTL